MEPAHLVPVKQRGWADKISFRALRLFFLQGLTFYKQLIPLRSISSPALILPQTFAAGPQAIFKHLWTFSLWNSRLIHHPSKWEPHVTMSIHSPSGPLKLHQHSHHTHQRGKGLGHSRWEYFAPSTETWPLRGATLKVSIIKDEMRKFFSVFSIPS